jgi:Sulfatase
VREETFARQKQLGVIPQDCALTARPREIPSWDDQPDTFKPTLAREMEVYAGYLSYADHHVGRLIDALADQGVLDDTLVYYILGDNGASAEGTLTGTINELLVERPDLLTPELMIAHKDDLGTPFGNNHYAVAWAHAMDTPYQWTKQVASHFGGTRNGTIVRWPKGIQAKGEIRHQFCHVIDVAPTVLEAAGLPEPTMVHGVLQEPMQGVSMAYSLDDAGAADRHETQYFEMVCNRGIYHKGWTAVTRHRTPWIVTGHAGALADDVWELYDTNTDWSQAHNLAAENPQKLADLQRLFELEATKYNVFPLDDRAAERLDPDTAGRPRAISGSTQLLYGGMHRLSENSVINVFNKSFSITAEIEVPEAGARGAIIACGGRFGGYSLYAHEGRPRYCYNYYGLDRTTIDGDGALPAGKHQVRLEFAYDGGGIGKGGAVSLYVDGTKTGEGRIGQTMPFHFSFDETLDIGKDTGTPVTDDYGARGNGFTGKVTWVQIDIDAAAADQDHLISPEERFHLALVRQ